MTNIIDAKILAKMFLAGAKDLESHKDWINELNVFPVPDGDTGTNMSLTILSACKELIALEDDGDMKAVCKAISSGSLRGARGNSGVILSQLFRGFTKSIRDLETISIPQIADACDKAVETAYKAVMKPKEGTILTVAKGMGLKARELADAGCDDLNVFISEIIKEGDLVLSKTPEMLPVLKQAGVVDSGGQGLMQVMKGAYDAYLGKVTDFTIGEVPAQSDTPDIKAQEKAEIKFAYSVEFTILLSKSVFNIKQEIDFKAYLESIGGSIALVADEEKVKVHVYTNDPGLAIQKGIKYGALSDIKIDNMRLEQKEKIHKAEQKTEKSVEPAIEEAPTMPHKEVGFIAVSVGDGLNEIFKGLGVDYIIEGGQTMNPSTEDMLNAIGKVNADTIFILPNNKNIIMAANQAKMMTEDKNIIVIPTKNVPQGITAIINYVADLSAEDNFAAMECEIQNVKTGQVTYAVRDTMIDDKTIHAGDYMGIGDSGLLSVGKDILDVTYGMISEMMNDEAELISVYYGSDVNEEQVDALREKVESQYPDCDIEIQSGGQPIYYYIISVE